MFSPENSFERSLMKAANDPAHRPQFYKDFLAAEIFFINHGPAPEKIERRTVKEGSHFRISNIEIDGEDHIPIFSSLPRLQAMIEDEVCFVNLNAKDFLETTLGANLVLNPGSDYGKQFTKEEISDLLSGAIWEPKSTYVTEKETNILIGQPQNYPHELSKALSRLFKKLKHVKSAYLAHFHNPESGDPPHTLIGIVAEGNWNEIVSQAGIVAESVPIPDPPLDFIKIEPNGSLTDYFLNESKPFYKKKLFGLI